MTRRRLESAKTIISGTKYLAEHTFSFEKYVTSLKAAFETLTECEEGMTANTQVYTLLENIECTNSQVMAAVAAVRVSQTLQLSFTDSANAISETVLLVFPDTQGKFKKRHVASVLPSRRTERGAAEEVAEAGEAEAAGTVVVVKAAREVAPMVVLTFPT
jgi:hypothetical protein